jgi:signal transduction histidine kinase
MLHQRDQLIYVGIVLLNMVYAFFDPITGGQLFILPGSPWREMLFGAVGGLVLIGYCRFTLKFFNLPAHDPVAERWMKRTQWALLSCAVLIVLPFWPGTAFANLATVTTVFLGAQIMLFSVGVRRWRAGVPLAPLFVLAIGIDMFGRLQFLAKTPDVVSRFDEQVFVFSLCKSGCLLFLSLAAAYRYRLVIDAHLALRNDYTARLERDVADRTRVLQSLSERLTATVVERDRILAIVGHDLRGPAGSLQSLARILAHDAVTFTPEEMASLSREIEEACGVQLELLNNLLVWGGAQAGHSLAADSHLVSDALAVAWKPLAAQAAHKQLALLNALPAGLKVKADAGLLQTILRNLLANAVKYTAPGGHIEVGGDVVASGQVEIWVRDNGTGIAPDRLAALFHGPVESITGTRDERGAGLGLRLCRDLARLADGDLRLESELGRGTTARVTLAGA